MLLFCKINSSLKAQPESSQLIYNTYLELCLNDMMHKQDGSRDKRDVEKKAMDLLQTGEVNYCRFFSVSNLSVSILLMHFPHLVIIHIFKYM